MPEGLSSLPVGSRDSPMSDADRNHGQIHSIRGGKDDPPRPKDCDALQQSSRVISPGTAALCNLMRKAPTPA